jgi:hypothetical protein
MVQVTFCGVIFKLRNVTWSYIFQIVFITLKFTLLHILYLFIVYLKTLSVAQTIVSNDRMMDELERICKEAVMTI